MSVPASAAPAASSSLPASLAGLVWRGGEMASAGSLSISSGHPSLDKVLPDAGWPRRGLIELLVSQPGVGEMRVLQPALLGLSGQRLAMLQPPHVPQIASWRAFGLAPERLLWIQTERDAEALWSAEQVLRNGSCAALLFWQRAVRTESLRRLQLAAQASDMLCWLVRPLSMAEAPSPAPLRLALRPDRQGLRIDVLKRRGPQCLTSVLLPWSPARPQMPDTDRRFAAEFPQELQDAFMDRHLPAFAAAAGAAPALV